MRHVRQSELVATAELVDSPFERACEDQTFELPTGIYIAMALMFAGFVAVLAIAFKSQMAVSYGVIFAFIAMFFAVPAVFPQVAPDHARRALRWDEFADGGIDTATGRVSARSASLLVLTLPFLILCFGIAIALISSIV